MLFVGFVVQRFAGLRVKFLSCPSAYRAIELDIWRIELWLSRFQHAVEAVNQPRNFVAVKMAVVIVEIIQIRLPIVLGLVVASLNAPHVGPVRRRRMISAEQVVGTRNPFVEIFLNEPRGNYTGFDNPSKPVIASSHVKSFLAQHVRHRASERREGRVFQHLQLKFSVTIDKIRIGKKIHPIINVNVERSQQAFVLESAPLQHFLGFDFAGIAKMFDEQCAHLPAVAHLLDHDTGDCAAIPVGRRGFKEMAFLLDAGEFGIALIDDHVEQGVAHLLRGYLTKVLPLAAALEVTELNLFGLDRAIERVELKLGDFITIDADLLAPLIEEADPVTEGSNFCYLAWHKTSVFSRSASVPLAVWRASPPIRAAKMAALRRVQPNCFYFRVMLDCVRTQLTSEAGAFVSAKRQCGIHQTIGVDPDRASAKLPRDGVGFFDVSGPDSGGKSVRLSIRQFADLIDVIEANRRQHGTEEFFLGNLHVVFDFAEDRGLMKK